MMEFLQALEASGFAMWIKESSTTYVAVLAFHTIGLAFLVGISTATAMRVLGVARSIPLAPMQDFFPLMYAGFWINALTGSLLLVLYPTDYLTDATIYLKLGAVVVAMVLLHRLRVNVFDGAGDAATRTPETKRLAAGVIGAWLVAMVAGRVMAYTWPTKVQTAAAVVVFLILAALVGYIAARSLGWIEPRGESTEEEGRHAGTS